jgi:hypothetical protein
MVVDPITGNSLIKSDLREIRSDAEAGLMSKEGFGRIFSSAIESIKSESIRTEKVKAADIAEIIKLEMLRNSMSIGEMNTEPPMVSTGRTRSLLLEGLDEYGKCASGPDNIQEEPVTADLDGGQVPADLNGIINRASERYHVAAGLIRAVIKAESNFNPNAVSRAGAQGLMQLMPSTARGLGVTNSFNPEQNVMAGTRFLKQMMDRYDGNIDSALAAYNWGPGNLEKKGGTLPRETSEYLIRVKGYYAQYSV